MFSAALSIGLRRLAVSQHPCPMLPGLSSSPRKKFCGERAATYLTLMLTKLTSFWIRARELLLKHSNLNSDEK